MENASSSECRTIVMEYLLHYSYKNSAKALLKDLNQFDDGGILFENNIDWAKVDARKEIHQAIVQGEIDVAFRLLEVHFPVLLQSVYEGKTSGAHFTLHKLRCQEFVEKVKKEGEMKAIAFAQAYLQPSHAVYREITDAVTCLLAYTDYDQNPKTRDITGQGRRDVIANQVNEMILESQQFSPQTIMEKLWRHKTVVRNELNHQIQLELSEHEKEFDMLEKEIAQ
ncbi:hypothetical protein INT47_006270 [Mucor saturninus]|uniref:CTLH domain-containing protein n=1 Tax=Mucor saturninus TaxID=64648 RepID=A0A8H7RHC3_9FUNG|nr:hypothetical protein INT47_006270 [Mucor saturninus]